MTREIRDVTGLGISVVTARTRAGVGVRVNTVGEKAGGMSTDAAEGGSENAVTVTPAAAEEALSLLRGEGMDVDEAGLRLFVQQGGCAGLSYGMRFDDAPEEDDTVTRHHGLRVFVDPASLNYVGGSTVDYESGLQAAGFHVENPNVVSECGCGESFRT
jgi:iron-sulfur cluster assembly protein